MLEKLACTGRASATWSCSTTNSRPVFPDGGRTERITSTLVDFGIRDGDCAMARTVSLPAAIAARLILEGKITQRGVLRPVHPEIYDPVLDELATLGIECKEE